MRQVKLQEATAEESLYFFRAKGTEFLREILPEAFRDSVMVFEYRFDPHPAKGRKLVVHYDRSEVPYGEALKEVLCQHGLTYQIQSIDRIAILDAPVDEAKIAAEEAERAGWPKTVDQAVERLLTELKPAVKLEIQKKTKDDLINFHFSLGMSIRNSYGLWGGNHALLHSTGESHPDQASGVIIDALWKKLQGMKTK